MQLAFYSRISLIGVLCTLSMANYAEELFELSLSELQSIPVEVASLFEDDTLNVASSTASISREAWQERGTLSLGQALEGVPSVFSNTTWGGSEAIAIRGYATELSVRGVAHFIDGIPLASYAYASPSYLLPRAPLNLFNQLEIIRGPGSTLYGSDAFHGVIAMELYNQAVDGGEFFMQTGTPEQAQISAVNSLHKGEWQFHSGGSIAQDGGHDLGFDYTHAITGNAEHSSREQGFENASAFFKVKYGQVSGKRGKFGLTFFYNDFSSQEFQGIGTQFFSSIANSFNVQSSSVAGAGDVSHSKTDLLVLGLSHEILLDKNVQLKNKIYSWQTQQEWTFDNTFYPTSVTTLSNVTLPCKADQNDSNPNPLYCPHLLYQGTSETRSGYALEIKQAKNKYNTQWVVGAGYDKASITDGRYERVNTSGVSSNLLTSEYVGKSREWSHLLAQGRTGFKQDSLLFTYGVRWDQYNDASNHTSPRLGLIHKLSHSWTHKLLYGHAYRAPTALEQYGSGSVVGNTEIKPETIDTLEYVHIFRQSNVELESVMFYSKWKNAISLVKVDDGNGAISKYKNSAQNNAHGLELSVRSQFGLSTFNGHISYVKSVNKTDDTDYVAFPQWLSSVNVEHILTPNKLTLGVWQRIMLNYELDDQDNSSQKKDYYRTDLYFKWKISSDVKFQFSLQNLLDQNNTLPSFYASQGGLSDHGRITRISLKVRL